MDVGDSMSLSAIFERCQMSVYINTAQIKMSSDIDWKYYSKQINIYVHLLAAEPFNRNLIICVGPLLLPLSCMRERKRLTGSAGTAQTV